MNKVTYEEKSVAPSKVVCVGRNYVEHIEELGNEMPEHMVLFNKPNSAISDRLRTFGPETRFEGELCFLVEDGELAGVGFGLDLTHADIQNRLKAKGLPWERAKSFDGAAVLGPFIPFTGAVEDLHFTLLRNGEIAQKANTNLMIYKPAEILAEIQSFMSLEDGDIIMTGTPKGVSTYEKGDRFEATVYEGEKELLRVSWIAE